MSAWSKPEYAAAFCQGYAWYWDCEDTRFDSPYTISPYPQFTNRQKAYVMGWNAAKREDLK
ncbi:MAG: hypothetical protein AAFX93_20090 [Verrucomicrobiota bacterium]